MFLPAPHSTIQNTPLLSGLPTPPSLPAQVSDFERTPSAAHVGSFLIRRKQGSEKLVEQSTDRRHSAMREARGCREALFREARSRGAMMHDPAAVAKAATHVSRALRASPFAWGDESHKAHFFSLVPRLPVACEFVARVSPLGRPDGRSSIAPGHRVRVQVRGSMLVVLHVDGSAAILGTVSLSEATIRFVRTGAVAVIPPASVVTSSLVGPSASTMANSSALRTRALSANAMSFTDDDASAIPMASLYIDRGSKQQQRRWRLPMLRRSKDAHGAPFNSRATSRGFVLELEELRRFATVVDALSTAVTVPRPPSLTRFEIVRPLCMGRTTSSYVVRDTQSGELLSMKLVRREDVGASDIMRRVVDERAALERIRGHPYVIDIRHSFMTDTLIVFLFEHCSGGNLDHQLRLRQRGLHQREAAGIIAQIALALEHVHRAGSAVYHDLKPENILLDSQGWIRLANFGMCCIHDSSIESGAANIHFQSSDVASVDAPPDRAARHSSLVGVRKTNRIRLAEQMHRATSEMVASSRSRSFVESLTPVISDRPEKVRRNKRGTGARVQCEYEEIASAMSDVALKRKSSPRPMPPALADLSCSQTSGLEELRSHAVDGRRSNRRYSPPLHNDIEGQMGHHRSSRISHQPVSSSTVTDCEQGSWNMSSSSAPRADNLMDENAYESSEMVLPHEKRSNEHGRCADMWSLGVLAHYVMTGTFPFSTDTISDPLQHASWFSKRAEVVLSSEISSVEARDFLEGLLCERPKERLGCGIGGMDEVRMHPWLRSIDWDDISRREGGYALKMLGDNRRTPFANDEAIEAARKICSFTGASRAHEKDNGHSLIPGPETSMDLKRMPTRALGLRMGSTASGRNPGRMRAKLSLRRRSNAVSKGTSLAHNVPGGSNPPGDGDVFGFAFSSSQPGYQPRPIGSVRATDAIGVSGAARRSSFAISQRLNSGNHKTRRLSRMGRSGRVFAYASFGGRRNTEVSSTSPRGSLEKLTSGSRKIIAARRSSIERAKIGDFVEIDPGDVEIPFRKSLDMAAAVRRQSLV